MNGGYRGNDALGKLMCDFACKEAKDMHYAELARSVDMTQYFSE